MHNLMPYSAIFCPSATCYMLYAETPELCKIMSDHKYWLDAICIKFTKSSEFMETVVRCTNEAFRNEAIICFRRKYTLCGTTGHV